MKKADKRQSALHFSPVLQRRKLIDETTGSAQFATAASRELKGLLEKCTSRPFQDVQVTFHLFRSQVNYYDMVAGDSHTRVRLITCEKTAVMNGGHRISSKQNS